MFAASALSVVVLLAASALFVGRTALMSKGRRVETKPPTPALQTTEDVSPKPIKESETYKIWQQLTGEQYDRNFLGNLIAHHEGTIEMAKLAVTNSQQLEIKELANEMLTIEPAEVTSYLIWQRQWGYPATSGIDMQDHTAMGMMNSAAQKKEELSSLTGSKFDSAFLRLMIEHQQEIIDMSQPGKTNAQHQEMMNLTEALVITQSNQIEKMRQWQKVWGF